MHTGKQERVIHVTAGGKLLTEYLAKNGAAIFAQAGASGIKGICELHECIAFVHGYS